MKPLQNLSGFLRYVFRLYIPIHVDPDTSVQVWNVFQYNKVSKAQISSSTWGESPFKGVHLSDGEYGIGNPIIIVVNTLNPKTVYTGMTLDVFMYLYGNIPTVSSQEYVSLRDEYGDMLAKAVKDLKEIHERIKK